MKRFDPDAFAEALMTLPVERMIAVNELIRGFSGADRRTALVRIADELDATHPELAASMREAASSLRPEPAGAFGAEFSAFARSSGDVVGEEAMARKMAGVMLRFIATRGEVDVMVRAHGGDLAAALEAGASELESGGGTTAAEQAGLMRMAAREARRTGATLASLRGEAAAPPVMH